MSYVFRLGACRLKSERYPYSSLFENVLYPEHVLIYVVIFHMIYSISNSAADMDLAENAHIEVYMDFWLEKYIFLQ